MSKMYKYFFPRRKLYRVPKHISSKYDRANMTKEQSIILMSGLARDPHEAQSVYLELKKEYGSKIWQYVEFHVRRKRVKTFRERFMMLMRRVFGEAERPNLRVRADEPIVYSDYAYED